MATHFHNASRRLLKADPTRTTLIRRRFQAEMKRRMNLLKKDVWDFIFVKDALGLKNRFPSGPGSLARISGLFGGTIARNEATDDPLTTLAAPQFREFEFKTDSDKVKAFRDWLDEQVKARVLSPSPDGKPGQPWTAKYIESAYKKGKANAFAKSKVKQSIFDPEFTKKQQTNFIIEAFGQPETTAKVELLATRSFEELKGISAAMGQQMNRILANAMVEGQGPLQIARDMSESIDGITNRRALTLARTEVIHAHAEGQLDQFTELGVEEVGVEAEWSTAGDDRVCPQCEEMEGKTFTVEEAHGLIPLHPNCRCTWIPKIPEALLK